MTVCDTSLDYPFLETFVKTSNNLSTDHKMIKLKICRSNLLENSSDQKVGQNVEEDIYYEDVLDHDNIDGDQKFYKGYCGYGAHVVSYIERSILNDLKIYLFPEDIKKHANIVYNKMKYQVRRGKIRNQMLFFCVYCAHLELGRYINPVQLGERFGLSQGEVQRCDSLFSSLQTGYKPPSTNTSPKEYLPEYCQIMELSIDAIEDIMKMSSIILMKDPTLYEENPQTVASGLLRYFIITNGITTDDPLKFAKITNRSTATIDAMYRRISIIDNS